MCLVKICTCDKSLVKTDFLLNILLSLPIALAAGTRLAEELRRLKSTDACERNFIYAHYGKYGSVLIFTELQNAQRYFVCRSVTLPNFTRLRSSIPGNYRQKVIDTPEQSMACTTIFMKLAVVNFIIFFFGGGHVYCTEVYPNRVKAVEDKATPMLAPTAVGG
jgi:uncharacterized protein (DUF1786 family)